MPPTLGNGKICYIQLPATDVARSAEFYQRCFGWEIRKRGDGATAFDDGVGQVSGAFITGREPADSGMIVYIMVDDMSATLEKIVAAGGKITQAVGADAPEITARFRDPGGNILGIYQERGLH